MAREIEARQRADAGQPPVPPKPHPLGGDRPSSAASSHHHRTGSVSGPPPPTKSAFEKSFGRLDEKSAEGQRVLGARPVHAKAERDDVRAGMDKRLGVLEKKDSLAEKVRASPQPPISLPNLSLPHHPASGRRCRESLCDGHPVPPGVSRGVCCGAVCRRLSLRHAST